MVVKCECTHFFCVPLQCEMYIDSTEQYYIISRIKESLLLT